MMEFAPYLDHEGIHHETTMPHTYLNKNVVVEHENQAIIENMCSMFHAKSILQEF